MKRRVLNCIDNYTNGVAAQFFKEYSPNKRFFDGIVRIVVITICSALFISGSSGAMAESGIASVYAYSGGKTASGERANPQMSAFGVKDILLLRSKRFSEVFCDRCVSLADGASLVSSFSQDRVGDLCPHPLTFRVIGLFGMAFGVFGGPRHRLVLLS
jgi:hypothetical protein